MSIFFYYETIFLVKEIPKTSHILYINVIVFFQVPFIQQYFFLHNQGYFSALFVFIAVEQG